MSAKKCQRDSVILLFTSAITSAFAECRRKLERLNKGFKFQSYLCNRCQYVLIMSMKLEDIYILNFKNADYCIISGISKSKGLKLFQNIDLTEKVELCKK